MGIFLAISSLGNKILVGFIFFVIIYGICIGPKGKSGSSKGGSRKGGNSNSGSLNRTTTKDLHFKAANKLQGHDMKRK